MASVCIPFARFCAHSMLDRILLFAEVDTTKLPLAQSKLEAKNNPFPASFVSWEQLQANQTTSPHQSGYRCVFAFSELDQHLFKDASSLQSFIQTISSLLKPGGYFVGTCYDSAEIFRHLVKQSQHGKTTVTTAKNLLTFQFDSVAATNALNSFKPQPFGVNYTATIEEESQACYMIHTPTLIASASRVGLELVDMPNCSEYLDEAKRNHPDFKKAVPSAKPPPNQPKTSVYILPEQKEVLGTFLRDSPRRPQ